MLSFFPDAPSGSTFFSRLICYHYLSGNSCVTISRKQLFCTRNATANDAFGISIKHLLNQIPNRLISAVDLLDRSTLFGLYSSTVASEVREAWRQRLTVEITRSVNSFTGGRGPLGRKNLHFCKFCVANDMENYGFGFWRLIHQVPGVNHCPIHNSELYGCCSVCNKPIASEYHWNPPSIACPFCGGLSFDATVSSKCPAYKVFVDLCDAAVRGLYVGLAPEERSYRYASVYPAGGDTSQEQRLDWFIERLLNGWQCDTLQDLSTALGVNVNRELINRAISGTDTAASPIIHLAIIATLPASNSTPELNVTASEPAPKPDVLRVLTPSILEKHSLEPSVVSEKLTQAVSQLGLPTILAVELLEGATNRSMRAKYGIAGRRITALRLELNNILARNSEPRIGLPEFVINAKHLQKLSENRNEILNSIRQDIDYEKLKEIMPSTIKWCQRHDRLWLSALGFELHQTKARHIISILVGQGYDTHRMLCLYGHSAYNWCRKHDGDWLYRLLEESHQNSSDRLTKYKSRRAIKQAISCGAETLPEQELSWARKHDSDWLLHMVPHMKMRALLAQENPVADIHTIEQITAASREIISYAVAHGSKERNRLPARAKNWAAEHDKEWLDTVIPLRSRRAHLQRLSWDELRDDCRKRILVALSTGRTDRQTLPTSAFKWCLRHDSQWLNENIPKKRPVKGDRYFDRIKDRPFTEIQASCREVVIRAINAGVCTRGRLPTRAKAWLYKHDPEWLDKIIPPKNRGWHRKTSRSVFNKPVEETRTYCRNSIMSSIEKGVRMRSKLPKRAKYWCYKNDREWLDAVCVDCLCQPGAAHNC